MSSYDRSGTSEYPSGGRRFTGHRKVRLGDTTATGRLRLDALTRYTQDVSDDDTTDAGLGSDRAWVVRKTRVETARSAVLAEELAFTTYCSALGRRWAERRLDIEGSEGARYQVITLWICLDPTTGRPAQISEQFLDLYTEAAAGRTVGARLEHPKPPPDAERWSWPLRVVDVDTIGHVNNAAYWAVAEQAVAGSALAERGPDWASIEYASGLVLNDDVTVHDATDGDRRHLWFHTAAAAMAASIALSTAPAAD
ncbi:MAG: acyl-ACP thioesterase domain-containing protein [Actinomycetota bacterium]